MHYSHHDVADLVNRRMVKNTKTWIAWERNVNFLQNKKILNLCLSLRWHIMTILKFIFFWFYIFIYVFCLHSNGGERALRKGQRAGTILHSWEDVFIGEGGR